MQRVWETPNEAQGWEGTCGDSEGWRGVGRSPPHTGPQPLPCPELCAFSTALCPNAATQQRLAALRYLCYKRFVEVRVPWLAP